MHILNGIFVLFVNLDRLVKIVPGIIPRCCFFDQLPLFRSFLILPWRFDKEKLLRLVFIAICPPTRRGMAGNHRLLSDLYGKNEPFHLIVSGYLHKTLAVRLLKCRVKAELLVVHQMIAKHDMNEFEFLLVDIESEKSRAAWLIEVP